VISIDVPIKDPKKPPKLVFPDYCVNCGKPKLKTWPVRLNTGAQKRGQMVQVEFDVPLCAKCSAKENKIGNVTWIPFFVVGAIVFMLVFIPVWLLSPNIITTQAVHIPSVLGASAGLLAGMIAGTLVEFLLKISFASSYGKLLLKRPLTMVSIFSDSEDLIGFSTRFAQNRKSLKLHFENDTIAREFMALNSQEIG